MLSPVCPSTMPGGVMLCPGYRLEALSQNRVETLIGSQAEFEITNYTRTPVVSENTIFEKLFKLN